MPTYDWDCPSCGAYWPIVCSVAARNDPRTCAECGSDGVRREVVPFRVDKVAASDWNTQGISPALGCYTRSNKHAQKIARERGLVEIGNESPETIHKHFDKQREEKRQSRWSDDRDKLYSED